MFGRYVACVVTTIAKMLRATCVSVTEDWYVHGHTTSQESPDGTKLVFACKDKVHIKTGTELRILDGHTAEVCCVVITADSSKAVTCAWDAKVIVWDLTTGKQLLVIKKARDRAITLAIYGNMLAISYTYHTISVWDLSTFTQCCTINRIQTVYAMRFNADGHLLTSAKRPDILCEWKLWLVSDSVEAFCGGYPGDEVVCVVERFLPHR